MAIYQKFNEQVAGLLSRLGIITPVAGYDFGKLRDIPAAARELGSLIGRMRSGVSFDIWCDTTPALSNAVFILALLTDGTKQMSAYQNCGGISMLGTPVEARRALVVHDVLSRETCPLDQIRELRRLGLIVEDLIFVVDAEDGAVADLETQGFRVHVGFRQSDLVKYHKEKIAKLA